MNTRLLALLLLGIAFGYSQTTTGDPPPAETPPDQAQPAASQQTPPAAPEQPATPSANQTQTPNKSNRSASPSQPVGKLIKPKDYSDQSGYFHPFARMGRYFLEDQKVIWTSPFHTSKSQAKYWLICGGITGALIATDKYTSKNAPNDPTLVRVGTDASYLGEPYVLLPIAAGWYFIGTAVGSDHFRETGLLSFESLANVTVEMVVLKSIFDRQRPTEPPGNGEFWKSNGPRYSSSFPSGHAITTMAVASVLVHEYPHKLWLKFVAYGYVAGVCGARLAANKHFPGDVAAGSALGWFTSAYVYNRRHNPDLGKKHSAEDWIMDHVHLGLGM